MPTFTLTNGNDSFAWDSVTFQNPNPVIVYGLDGNDTIWGGSGADTLHGGNGRDNLFGRNGDDYLYGGAGNDFLGEDNLNTGDDSIYGEAGDDEAYGSSGNDALYGGDGNDELHGGDDNDLLVGETGADRLFGGTGNDRLIIDGSFAHGADHVSGGHGDDVYVIQSGNVTIAAATEAADPGLDLVETLASANIGAFLGLEEVILRGSADTSATGNARDNRLVGNAGHNTLTGGGGVDTMIGNAGNDRYHVDSVFDRAIEQADQGIDDIYSTVSLTLAGRAHVENLTLQGAAIFATGNTLANRLVGNTSGNVLNGGAGYDTLEGGLDNDVYYLDDVSLVSISGFPFTRYDKVVETGGAGIDTIHVGEQPDFVTTGMIRLYRLDANVENGVVTGSGAFDIEGNGLDNRFYGNAAANTLTGLNGADVLEGAGGHDILIGGPGGDTYFLVDNAPFQLGGFTVWGYDEVRETSGSAYGGYDTVVVGRAANPQLASGFTTGYTLDAPVEKGVVHGAAAFNLGGNGLDNHLVGNDAANSLGGGAAGADVLEGWGGADFLDGGTGADIMSGGTGNDIFVVDSLGDQVDEFSNGGIDGVIARISYILPVNVESLSLFGSSDLAGTGNAMHNRLQGQFGANTLDGGAGDDWLEGFGADDILIGGLGNDRLDGGDGLDRLYDREGDDIVFGDADADQLFAGAGFDRLDGGAGPDRLYADAATGDTFVFASAVGIDRVFDFVSGLHKLEILALAFGGEAGSFIFRANANPVAPSATRAILYDTDDGRVLFDPDGSGASAPVHVLTLLGAPALTAGDVLLV